MNRTFKAAVAALIFAAGFAGSVAAGPFAFGEAATAHNNGDYATELRIIRPLAEQGNALAQYLLANMYYRGDGMPRDYVAAASWYRKAAEQGGEDAQNSLGNMYLNGEGVPQDYVSAHMWFNLAAAAGYMGAATMRGVVALQMTPAQIAEAQKLAREWRPK